MSDDSVYCLNCKKEISVQEANLYMGHCEVCGGLGIWDLLS
jgi:transcription initiation factor IIE alpha subunit